LAEFIIDTKTTNKSFIKMHKILKSLGIKNNKFFLRLYDKSLQGVDPRDEENLTKEQKIRITAEVRRNPWYFFREIVVLPVAGGKKRFQIHRGNLAMMYCMLNNLNSMTVLPRQHGKTVSSVCVFIWIYHYATENSQILFLNKELQDSKRNLRTFKEITELLPSYLKIKHKKDKDNIEGIENGSNGNTIRVSGAAITPAEADKKGRGTTTPLQLWDEFAFLKYNDVMYGASAPATSQARIEAKENGKIYGVTMITTPNNIDIPEGKFCKIDFINKMCMFDEVMYDWTLKDLNDWIEEKSDNNFIYIEFSYKQLGRDEKWFQDQCKALNQNWLLIKREILLEWTKATDTSIYTEEQLDKIESLMMPVKYKLQLRKFYYMDIYVQDLDFDKPYVVACDVATGQELDASTICVLDPHSLKPVAEFRDNKILIEEFKRLLFDLVGHYFVNSVLVIENNTVSKHMLEWLSNSSIKSRLYYEYQMKEAQKIEESAKEKVFTKNKKKTKVYGVVTSSASRPLMLDILDDTVVNDPELIATKNLYTDIKHLERNKKGKIEHAEGYHDDSLFAYLIGRYTLVYGKNLAKFMIGSSSKTIEDRKSSIYRVGYELSKANNDIKHQYKGIAEDMVNEDIRKRTRDRQSKNHKMDFYLKMSNLDNLDNNALRDLDDLHKSKYLF
jgi:hypothetical protein